MPFTRTPPGLKVPLKTRHTELVAVLGKAERYSQLHVAVGDELLTERYGGRGRPYLQERWSWEAGAQQRVARAGNLVAAREDGTVVACRDPDPGNYGGNFLFDVWQGGKKRRTISLPKFESMGAQQRAATFAHGVLVYERQAVDDESISAMREGKGNFRTLLRLVNVDNGSTVDLINGTRGPGLTLRSAPNRQLAVLQGKELAFFDVDRGRKRGALTLKIPDKHAIAELALSPDGTTAVAGLIHVPSPTASFRWRGYHVISLRTGKVTHKLQGEEPESLVFAGEGRVLAAISSAGTLTLWDTGRWKLLERFKLGPGCADGARLIPWDARGALVVQVEVGLTYVFKLSAVPATDLERGRLNEPSADQADRRTQKKLPAKTGASKRTRAWPTRAFRFALGARGGDQFGGVPRLPGNQWPSCEHCEEPMMFVLALDASRDRLPLEQHDALMLFICTSGTCDTFEPFGGGNAAVLVSKSKEAPKTPRGILGRPSAMRPRKLRYTAATKAGEEAIPNKVGGAPDWLQGNETPVCPHCKRKMRFVMQLNETVDAKLNFASGVGYLFVCEDEHDARFLWQS